MDYATELYQILSLYFSGNKARVVCMTNILIGLLRAASTNLNKATRHMPGGTKFVSKYRRVQRFFAQVNLNWDQLAAFIVQQISINDKYTLILDRTNWKIGTVNINFLVLAVAWHGISIPVYWINLGRAGNSNTNERMQILSKFIKLFGVDKIEIFLADREFIGDDWLHWLDHYGVKFVIKIKCNSKIYYNKRYKRALKSFRSLRRGSIRTLKCTLWDLELTIVGYKHTDGEVYILATNGAPNLAVDLYSIRWQIESMFLCLKSNGFNLEDTHMVDANKLELLFGLLAILTCWNCKIGCWFHAIKPIKIKNHDRPEQNLFHYGMTMISTILNNVLDYANDFRNILRILEKPHLIDRSSHDMEWQCI